MDRRYRPLTAGLIALAAGSMPCRAVEPEAAGHRLAFVQAPVLATRPAGTDVANTILAGRYLSGMRIAVADLDNVSETVRIATEGFVCATDPVFSFDGKRLAFAGQRKSGDRLQIWELVGDDPEPRLIVTCDADCVSPLYMPSGHVVFASLLAREYEEHGGQYSFSLYELAPGDESPVRLTFNPSSEFDPAVLPDGRLVFSSWQHVGNHHWPRGMISLMLVNSDGTGVFPLTGNHRGPWLKRGAKPLALDTPRLATRNRSRSDRRTSSVAASQGLGAYGQPAKSDLVAFIRAERLDNFGAGELVTTSLNDAFAPYETLTPYDVSDVSPLPDGRLLLSARVGAMPGLTETRPSGSVFDPADEGASRGLKPAARGDHPTQQDSAADSDATFGLYVRDDDTIQLLYDTPGYHELAPAVGVSPRGGRPIARPDVRISTVVPDTPYGYLAVLNCYDTDRTEQHRLRDGSIGLVRVIEGRPIRYGKPVGAREDSRTSKEDGVGARGDSRTSDEATGPTFFSVPGREDEPLIRPNSAAGYIPARILGEVPPAADGSIYLKVPADRPLRIQLVDREGFTIISERAWFWVRPNERRVCIGCHENRELAPANATPLASRRGPTDLTDPAGFETVTFRKDIQPILGRSCAVTDCHIPPNPTAGLNQTADKLNGDKDAPLADRFGPAYANLLARQENKPFAIGGRRVHPGDARSSPMLWMLYGRALARQYKPAPFERPLLEAHPGPMLPEAQLELIRKWVDLGAPYDDDSPPGPWPYEIPPAAAAPQEAKP